MKPAVRQELVNSVRLARALGHSAVYYETAARTYRRANRGDRARELGDKAAAARSHATWWLHHARDLRERYG